ncbi:MAG: hypothetical protein ACRCZP_10205 [Phycicoccus sp.]
MARDSFRVDVRILNLPQIQAKLSRLPADARAELREGSRRIARALAAKAKAAGRAEGRQAARAATTVRALAGSTPAVTAGPHPLLFGSEFGATRKFGWYAAGRYYRSAAKQFKPHRGAGSYWFFTTLSREQPAVDAEYRGMADAIARRWAD